VGFSCHTEEQYFKLDYRIRGIGEDEWIKIEHSYPLVTTQCNYGGTRFWFECSVYTNGLYCGNRVAKLYLAPNGKYFACRHCYQLSYASRKEPRSGIAGSFVKVLTLEKRVDAMYKKLKIPYRKGQPTKRLQKIKELENMGFNIMANRV
jgi:hypothetical protein